MKLVTRILLLAIGLITLVGANAQKSDSTTTIIFSKVTSSTVHAAKKHKVANNIIKVSPTGIAVGQFPINYERRITENLSIQIGAGLTDQNYIRMTFSEVNDKSQDNKDYPWSDVSRGYDKAPKIYEFENGRKAVMGTMFTIQPKIYIEDDALDGRYIGFSFTQSTYKFTIPKGVYAGGDVKFTGAEQSESEKVNDFMLHFGNQSVNGHFVWEYSTAIGLRKVSGNKYGVSNETSNNKVYDGFIPYNQTLLNYELAIRVGYVF